MIKNFEKFPFVKDKHNNVWKYVKTKDHFIKVTPWKSGEDRRINRFEIEKRILSNTLIQMTNKPVIHKIINDRWRDEDFSWNYNGNTFYVDQFHSYNDCMKAPIHKFKHKYKDKDGNWREYFNEYRIGFHNGDLVWFNPYHYFPQLCIWIFEDIKKEPKGWHSWGNAKSIRPIYNDKYEII